ncbi:ABC transporter ATP-binding protein [Marinobacterium aestuariivivens]|uniref:ABC transporter ATP-binding protein n=1 Tax=Marinobacterium aestuariivivens TaxID=1698799 RepID=A0ABW2A3I8_9GAMM
MTRSESQTDAAPAEVLLKAENIVKHYDSRRGLWGKLTGNPGNLVAAVNGASLEIRRGETVGLIGESGCGKSTLGRTLLRLHEPTSGRILFDGTDVTSLSPAEMKAMRQHMQIIFQDPYASLNPRKTVEELVGLPLKLQGVTKKAELRERVAEIVTNVGLKTSHLSRYPHQFSGGQRQRIGIARALILHPQFVVCDEPVSALDVSIQAQVIKLLGDLKRELGLTYLFISHDISVIGYISDSIAVMYLGEIVESGPTREVLKNPSHPYTQALLSAVPRVGHAKQGHERIRLQGDLPTPLNLPSGCKFHTRCPYAYERCRTEAPQHHQAGESHRAACHLLDPNIIARQQEAPE